MANSLIYIERQLRNGKTPDKLGGKRIGAGVCKAAYFFESANGGFVVKRNAQGGWAGESKKLPPKEILKVQNVRAPRTYKAGDYLIQEYAKPLKELERRVPDKLIPAWESLQKLRYDLHMGNVGV